MEDTRSNNSKKFQNTTNIGLNEYKASNLNVNTYIQQLIANNINIHPKNNFIKEIKQLIENKKEKKNQN